MKRFVSRLRNKLAQNQALNGVAGAAGAYLIFLYVGGTILVVLGFISISIYGLIANHYPEVEIFVETLLLVSGSGKVTDLLLLVAGALAMTALAIVSSYAGWIFVLDSYLSATRFVAAPKKRIKRAIGSGPLTTTHNGLKWLIEVIFMLNAAIFGPIILMLFLGSPILSSLGYAGLVSSVESVSNILISTLTAQSVGLTYAIIVLLYLTTLLLLAVEETVQHILDLVR
ncbi:hypothetical protein [Haloferax volcanii]|uniref:hypothetical protein n=1 Tax=Haloferax volcanii TaxID=2246 RepID=UPI00249A3016|nr:hypothetical protein [Haloferax alexandrinus]